MIVGIVGYRNFHNYESFKSNVNDWVKNNSEITLIVSGAAPGADTLAAKYADEYGIDIVVYSADWKKFGKKAGPLRNTLIVDKSEHLIAFLSKKSRGTLDTINKAKVKRIPVTVIQVD